MKNKKRFSSKLQFLLIILLVGAIALTISAMFFNGPADKGEYLRVLSTGSQEDILDVIDSFRKNFYRRPVIQIATDIWEVRKDKYPEFEWNILEKDLVRLRISEVLVQAVRNRFIDYDLSSIRAYALERLSSGDLDEQIEAITIIGLIENEADVDRLVELASDGKDPIFTEVVGVLSTMCIQKAQAALNKLIETDTNAARKQELSARVAAIRRFKEEKSLCKKEPGYPLLRP